MDKKEQKKLNKIGKQLDFQQINKTPQYKPGSSGKVIATQFGIKRPLKEQVNMKNPNYRNFQTTGIIPQRHVYKDMSLEQHVQRNDEMTQNFVERVTAFHAASLGGANTEWKKKENKSTLKNRGIPNVKQKKTMGSTVKKILKSPRLLTPAGLMSYIMRPKALGASTLTKTTGEYKKVK